MRKKGSLILALLMTVFLALPSFAAVGAKSDGTSIGAAMDIDFSTGLTATSDGSTVTLKKARIGDGVALTSSSTVAVDFASASSYKITPVTSGTFTTTVTDCVFGDTGTLIISSSGSDNENFVFGTGFKSSGSVGTGTQVNKTTTIMFINDGVNWNEVSRATKM
jgi:hypothetical protein